MKPKEIREMSIKDSPIEDTSKIRKAGKDIARMLTILTEKENQAKVEE